MAALVEPLVKVILGSSSTIVRSSCVLHASPVVPQSPEFMGEDPEEIQRGAELCKCGSEATNRGHSIQRLF